MATRLRRDWTAVSGIRGEIPASRLSIDEQRWARTLVPQLERIRRDLDLPQEAPPEG
jgi:hypothetical protein